MSPKFYGFLWVVFSVSAGVLWLGDVFTMLAAVIFGFIAFGLVFTGMMCVLPGKVSHPYVSKVKMPMPKMEVDPVARPVNATASHVHYPIVFRFH